MKKIILLVFLPLLAASCSWAPKNNDNSRAPAGSKSAMDAPQGTKETWEIYANPGYGFSFRYPKNDFVVYADYDQTKVLSYIPVCDEHMTVCLYYPKTKQPDTNFEGAGLSVNILTDKTSAKSCLYIEGIAARDSGAPSVQTVNGESFAFADGSEGTAGHERGIRIYRKFQNNLCYELQVSLVSANIGVYPLGTVKEYSRVEVLGRFDQILSTFTFLKRVN